MVCSGRFGAWWILDICNIGGEFSFASMSRLSPTQGLKHERTRFILYSGADPDTSTMNKKEIKEKYTRIVKMGDKWNTYLQIDHQGFCVCEQTTKKRADWYVDMLTTALQRLLIETKLEAPNQN